jgi:hypothetical protein
VLLANSRAFLLLDFIDIAELHLLGVLMYFGLKVLLK